MHRSGSCAIFLVAVLLCGCGTSMRTPGRKASADLHGFDPASLDTSQAACTDFARYASGGWMASHPIPAAESEWGTISLLVEDNRQTLRRIVDEAVAAKDNPLGSNRQKIADFYSSCMAEESINRDGIAPLAGELQRIRSAVDLESLATAIGRLQSVAVDAPFAVSSAADARNSSEVVLEISQGGLGLPDREYYLRSDEKSKQIRDAYVAHVTRMFTLTGDDASLASQEAGAVLALETRLAAASMTRTQTRDPQATSNWMTIAELRAAAPSFPWSSWFAAIGIPPPVGLNVAQPQFIGAFDRELSLTSLADWRSYLRWRLLHRFAPALSAAFVDETFNFYSGTLKGATEQTPRWQRCVGSTTAALSEAMGQLYVEQRFTPEARTHAQELVGNVVEAFRARIGSLKWMDAATRSQALQKLDALGRKVGYPDKWRDYSALVVERGPYVANSIRAAQFDFAQDLAKIGRPADRTVWKMSAQSPNASYVAPRNEIVITAAVLQPPLYDPAADDAYNYGGIGALIGHELTHAFDDRGAKYDAEGNLKNWWSQEAMGEFRTRTDCVVDQFNGFSIDADTHMNGKLVLGESVADLGGAMVAYDAFEKSLQGKRRIVIGGFTPEQRFFLGWARMWTVNIRPETARLRATTDFHPVGNFRINGPLSNMPAFATAYGCRAGEAMVRLQRCDIW
jgi:putative endopeptidase